MIYTTNSNASLYSDFAELNGNLYTVNGLTRNQAQDAASTTARNMSIRMTGGAMHNLAEAGGGSLTTTSTYKYIYTYYNSNKGVESDPYATALSHLLTAANCKITFDIPADATMDSQVTHVRVYRTNANGAIYYYEQQAAYTNAEITITSTIADTSLGSAFGELSFDGTSQTYINGVAPTCPYIETFANRIWLAGNKIYSTGTIAVTQTTTTVTGAGTAWTEAMIGMNFRILADSKVYTITAVASTTSLTISEAYLATTRTVSTYNIYQYGSILFYSYIDQDGNARSESFPGADYIPVNEGDGDIGIITG
jgi:hypothetical protein